MLNQCNLKLSPNGLEYRFFFNNEQIKKESIVLTQNWKEIFNYLELDYEKWKKGFQTVEDMFEMIISCKYFKKELYPLENLNHHNRMRDKKRPNYNKFLKYIQNKNIINKFKDKYDDQYKVSYDALKYFNKVDIYQKKLKTYQNKETLKKFFNGNVVNKLFNVENVELGNYLKLFKSRYNELVEKAIIINEKELSLKEKEDEFNLFLMKLFKKLKN